ncbi:MAG: hypothetical protein HRT72_04615 [Flavobacteriales bacterium]|nr:hypothetical protein [Flavobacteriales bacterium]
MKTSSILIASLVSITMISCGGGAEEADTNAEDPASTTEGTEQNTSKAKETVKKIVPKPKITVKPVDTNIEIDADKHTKKMGKKGAKMGKKGSKNLVKKRKKN